MNPLVRISLLAFCNFLFPCNIQAYFALVDFEIVRFRILDREKAAGGSRCDSDGWFGKYNLCDFVLYVKNCTQVPRDGGQRCSTRINRFYAKENSDDVAFSEATVRPVTAFVVDSYVRENVIRIEVNDQDDGYSADDPIGVFQLLVPGEAIDPRGQQFAPITEQIILIPDHSEMTVRYRAYCVDEECRSRRPGLDQAGPPGTFGRLIQSNQPSEAWTVSKNGKDPAQWTGSMRPVALQQSLSPQALGPPRFGGQPENVFPPQQLQGHIPVPGQGPGQRPPFVEWSRPNAIGERSAPPGGAGAGFPASLNTENSFFPGHHAAPAPAAPENPFGPTHTGAVPVPNSVPAGFPSPSAVGHGHGIDETERQHQSGSGGEQGPKQGQVPAQTPHLLGFHCENGRCSADSPAEQRAFQSQQHEQKQNPTQIQTSNEAHHPQQLPELPHEPGNQPQEHPIPGKSQEDQHPFQPQWQRGPDQHQQEHQDQGQGHQGHQQQPFGFQYPQKPQIDSQHQSIPSLPSHEHGQAQPQPQPQSQSQHGSQATIFEKPLHEQSEGASGKLIMHPSVVVQVMDNSSSTTTGFPVHQANKEHAG